MNRAWMMAGLHRRKFLSLSAAVGIAGLAGCHGPWWGKDKIRAGPRSATTRPTSTPPPPSAARPRSATPSRSWSAASGWSTACPAPAAAPRPAGGASCWKTASRSRLDTRHLRAARRPAQDDLAGARVGPHPARARKGDAVDVQISLPDESKTTSLKGGGSCRASCSTPTPPATCGRSPRGRGPAGPSGEPPQGNVWAVAEGPVVAGQFIPASGKVEDRGGRRRPAVFKAGRRLGRRAGRPSRHYLVLLKPGEQEPAYGLQHRRAAQRHLPRERRPEPEGGRGQDPRADPGQRADAYRHNHYRFLLVARQVPMVPAARRTACTAGSSKRSCSTRPPRCAAAVKLEALGGRQPAAAAGRPGKPVAVGPVRGRGGAGVPRPDRRRGRTGEDSRRSTRPCGPRPEGARPSMDDAACTDRLARADRPAPTRVLRYGAFIALRLADENNPAVRGTLLEQLVLAAPRRPRRRPAWST